ncbi:hypothetical protein HNQ56_001797 [Anaerotaenia torta]|uniref:hypothetical protein n=1 Tax=Anaerotaenia torta TaxID=433293 RepID=UPI003D21540D
MKRLIFRSQIKDGYEDKVTNLLKKEKEVQGLVEDGHAMVIAAYYWEKNIFLYCECLKDEVQPEELFQSVGDYLEDWPGKEVKRKWIPMIDVFHFNEPVSEEHWRRKEPVESRKGRVARLKPEMMSSYIYYHYQLQEERAFLGPKYEIIAMHENLLFGYQEFPAIVEEPLAPKKLSTSGTPQNWNDSRMDLHFQPWEDGHLYFKHIEPIFVYHAL